MRKQLFSLGQVVGTPGAIEAIQNSDQTPLEFIARHVMGDWGTGDSSEVRKRENEEAEGLRTEGSTSAFYSQSPPLWGRPLLWVRARVTLEFGDTIENSRIRKFQRLNGVVLVFLLLLSACGGGSQPDPEPTAAPPLPEPAKSQVIIVAMGDSLTEGLGVDPDEAYPAQLESRLLEDGYIVKVINAGISGETSTGALSRIDWVMTLEPDIVILETGPNDGLRGIDPALTAQNIDVLVSTFQANDVEVVLAGLQIVQNMGEEYVTEFRAIYPNVAEAYGLILIPFFLDGVGGVKELNQADAVHPTQEGYAIVVETIYPYVVEALRALE